MLECMKSRILEEEIVASFLILENAGQRCSVEDYDEELSISGWSATASWAGPTRTRSCRRRGFSICRIKPVLKAVVARNADRVKAFAANWGYESIETDWRKLVERKDIDVIDIASPNDTHHDIAIAAAKAGKMVMCEKPLGRTAQKPKRWSTRSKAAGVAEHRLVQLPPRPGRRRCIKHLIDEGKFGRIFHYRAKFLQDWTISAGLAAGRRRPLAARRRGRGQRRHRRSPRAQHRHGAVAERPDHRSHRR